MHGRRKAEYAPYDSGQRDCRSPTARLLDTLEQIAALKRKFNDNPRKIHAIVMANTKCTDGQLADPTLTQGLLTLLVPLPRATKT